MGDEAKTEFIRTMYDYNAWANKRILDTAAQLTQEQLLAKLGASNESVRDKLVHSIAAKLLFYSPISDTRPAGLIFSYSLMNETHNEMDVGVQLIAPLHPS